jgi:hypothetical protein
MDHTLLSANKPFALLTFLGIQLAYNIHILCPQQKHFAVILFIFQDAGGERGGCGAQE